MSILVLSCMVLDDAGAMGPDCQKHIVASGAEAHNFCILQRVDLPGCWRNHSFDSNTLVEARLLGQP
jgi:hypothetical protein